MKVSIIVPFYNAETYIHRCFDSIVSQTYTKIECIFIDDCSPDHCYAILHTRIAQYSGNIDFQIIRHNQNKGVSVAWNTGTLAATGEYVYYLDSDDEITRDCVETLVNLAKTYPGIDIVQGNTKTVPTPEVNWMDFGGKHYPEYVTDNVWIKKFYLQGAHFLAPCWNKLIKKISLSKII